MDDYTILRVVNMLIPDNDEAEEMVTERALTFAPGSNLHQALDKDPNIDMNEYLNDYIILSGGKSCEVIKSDAQFCTFYIVDGEIVGFDCFPVYICGELLYLPTTLHHLPPMMTQYPHQMTMIAAAVFPPRMMMTIVETKIFVKQTVTRWTIPSVFATFLTPLKSVLKTRRNPNRVIRGMRWWTIWLYKVIYKNFGS